MFKHQEMSDKNGEIRSLAGELALVIGRQSAVGEQRQGLPVEMAVTPGVAIVSSPPSTACHWHH